MSATEMGGLVRYAVDAIDLASLRRKDGAFTVTAYRCPGSSPPHWHVGHRPQPHRRRRHR